MPWVSGLPIPKVLKGKKAQRSQPCSFLPERAEPANKVVAGRTNSEGGQKAREG
jgi:hypothetical protein